MENHIQDNPIYCKIKQRRAQILVHSCIYYELNDSIIEDAKFDEFARELVDLQSKYPEISEQVEWHVHFKDFDGTTGYHLPLTHPWVVNKAKYLLRISGKQI